MAQQAIGIFDSGVGGISVAKAIHQLLPNEHLIYVADSHYAPYGDKSAQYIESRTRTIVKRLQQLDVKAIVVACNTATVNIIQLLRAELSIPVIGIEPGVKPAVMKSKSKRVGVLATQNTVLSSAYNRLTTLYAEECDILSQACPEFVDIVENKQLNSKETESIINRYIQPLLDQGCDQIVLGCTHFPFLKPQIQRLISGQAEIVDTSLAVAKQLKTVLTEQQMLNNNQESGQVKFLSSDLPHKASALISHLWQQEVLVTSLS